MSDLGQTTVAMPARSWGRWAQAGWILVVLATLLVIAYTIPVYPAFFRSVFVPMDQFLDQYGLPVTLRAVWYVILDSLFLLVFVSTAAIIFWRKPNDPAAILFSLTLLCYPIVSLPIDRALGQSTPFAQALQRGVAYFGAVGSFTFGYLFPNGRFVPRWTRWLALGLVLWTLLWFLIPPINPNNWQPGPTAAVELIIYGSGIAAQVYRYRRVSTVVQRQQTKWVIFGFAAALVGYLLFLFPNEILPNTTVSIIIAHLVTGTLYRLAEMLVPITIAFSIFRYRLWDVDFIINRGLIYGALSLLLGLVFLGAIFALQPLLLALTGGRQPTLAAVGATLAVVALFNPARTGLRRLVDRQLYGIKVDYTGPAAPESPGPAGSTTNIGPYNGLQLIGRGGMGEVYRGRHPTSGQPIAVKVLPAALASDGGFRSRFEREGRALARLSHPNIVGVYEFGEAAGTPYLVMEYIQGHDPAEHLRQSGPLALKEAGAILGEIAAALDYAHAQGLVHRDIKASNVMLEEKEAGRRAVLMDFGIAKLAGGTALTNTGMLGTFEYMSPEQIQAAANVDGRADVYSLGVLAFQMLTGQLPFPATSPAAILIAHLQTPPPDPGSIRPDLPPLASAAIVRALAKEPGRRFDTAGAFASALT